MQPSDGALSWATILETALDQPYFRATAEMPPAIPVGYVAGRVPLLAVVGPNAGGKSVFRRIVRQCAAAAGIECIAISMEFRTALNNPARGFVFGAEDWQSTGVISAKTVLQGIATCRERDTPHVIVWDEPDLGLSDGYAAGMGQTLAAFARALPPHTLGAVVVTHSRPLLRQLVALAPYYLHLGTADPPATLAAWLDAPTPVLPLEELADSAHARFLRVTSIRRARR